MPHKLKQIEIDEISFVTKGASGDAEHAPKIVFWKGKPMADKPTFLDRLKGVFAKAEDGGRTPEQMLEDLKGQLSPEQQDILMLLLAAAKASPPPAPSMEPAPEPVEPEKLEDEDEEMEKILKSNPKLAEHLAKIEAARKADREEIAELRKADKERAKRERRAGFKKQVEQYMWMPGDHDEVAAMMDEVDSKLSPESQETLAGLIRSTDGLIRKASGDKFAERGSSMPGNDDEDVHAKVLQIAKSIQKDNPGMTIEKAKVEAMRQHKELRRELNRGRRVGH